MALCTATCHGKRWSLLCWPLLCLWARVCGGPPRPRPRACLAAPTKSGMRFQGVRLALARGFGLKSRATPPKKHNHPELNRPSARVKSVHGAASKARPSSVRLVSRVSRRSRDSGHTPGAGSCGFGAERAAGRRQTVTAASAPHEARRALIAWPAAWAPPYRWMDGGGGRARALSGRQLYGHSTDLKRSPRPTGSIRFPPTSSSRV